MVSPATSDWLRSVDDEAVIEPELPIVDSHHHLFHRPDGSRYLLEDVLADIAGNNVRQTVFVQANAMLRAGGPEEFRVVGEVEWVNGIAAASASGRYGDARIAAGIVGAANLLLGEGVGPVLDALMAASPRFRGIRHGVAWCDPPLRPTPNTAHMLLDPVFRKGFAQLRTRGLSFDVWLYFSQIDDLVDIARAFPDTSLVLNNSGGPLGVGAWEGKLGEVFEAWKPAITRLSACPNVTVKVGGIGMGHINGFGWEKRPRPPSSDDLLQVNRPWFEHLIESFGPSRCMFESNFPPDKTSSSYTVLWNHFKKLTRSFSASERAMMFHGTARRVYRLPDLA